MKDKSLGVFLILLFGGLGITILMLAWLRPMPESERILSTFLGSIGLFVALSQVLLLKPSKAGAEAEPDLVEVEVKGKP